MLEDSQILAMIEEYEKNSYGQNDQALSDEREEALDRFYGRPYGDEVDGRSQVVSQDTRDTILWVMPQLMKIFSSGDQVVNFSPKSAQDVEAAEQETAYINHLVLEKNRGFETLYCWFFDALLSKVGYVKVYWEDYEESKKETYQNLSVEEVTFLLQDKDLEILAHDAVVDEFGREYHTITLEYKEKNGCVHICNVPPENMMVDYGVSGTSLCDADFVEEMSQTTLGDLRAQGYDVDENMAGDADLNWGGEEQARDNYSEFEADSWQTGLLRKVTLREVYMRMEDEDGDLSLYRIVVAGKTILEKEEAEVIPYASLCPIPMPHRHIGLSYADIVMDLERIKTQLLRNALDAQYLSIHGRHAVNKNTVDLDDMLVSRHGALVRVDGPPAGEIMPLVNPVTGDTALNAMEYIDRIRETRTGVSERSQGIGEDAMQETATATAKLMTAAQERIYMIARIFSETGVKDLYMLTHGLARKHANKEAIFQLRNKWVPIDPRTWTTRKDLTVSVGLGTGDKDEMRQHLMTIITAQTKVLPMGIATPKNLYNALAKLTQNAGFKDVEEFWTDPAEGQGQPQQPNPEMIKIQAQMQMQQQKSQMEMQQHQQEMALDMQMREKELALEAQKQAMQAQNDMKERQHQADLKAMQDTQQRQFDEWKAKLDAQVDIIVAQIAAAAKEAAQPTKAQQAAEQGYTSE